MQINNQIEKIFKKPLIQIARDFNYHKSNLLLLDKNYVNDDKLSLLKSIHPDIYNNLLSCKRNADHRDLIEYAKDLISSWLLEDTILFYLKKFGVNINLSGADKNRLILKDNKISTGSDYKLYSNIQHKLINVELVASYTNRWGKFMEIDLRNDKFLKLKKNNSLLLCLDVFYKKFFILDLNNVDENSVIYIENYKPYGNKPVYKIFLKNINVYNLSLINLSNVLKSI